MRKAAYWAEFQVHALAQGLARELPSFDVMEVLLPACIPIRGKVKTHKGVWREIAGTALYAPGEVLHAAWRKATEWEQEEWQVLSAAEQKRLGLFQEQGRFSVQIVGRVKDLPAMIRQRSRHIPGTKIARQQKSFTIPGDALLLASFAERLNEVTRRLLGPGAPEVDRESTKELSQLARELARAKSRLKQLALREISLAQQGRFWEVSMRTSQAASLLLQERANSYEIVLKELELAEKLLSLMKDAERRFRNCYRRLGQLAEALDPLLHQERPDSQRVLDIAREAKGIWLHLKENVPGFNPYLERLQAPQFQRLSRAVEHAKQGRMGTLLNDIKGAAAKLEAVALKERPTQAEIARQRARIG